jgi:hypothetical protein
MQPPIRCGNYSGNRPLAAIGDFEHAEFCLWECFT